MPTKEDKEFQLEMLKIQIKHQTLWSSMTLLIAVEFATFTSIATAYLSFGLTSDNILYIVLGAFFLVALGIIARGTIYYFQREKTKRELDKNLEKGFQSIRDRFITKKSEQNENKDEEKPKAESVESKNDEELQRKKYINSPLLLEYKMTQQMHNHYGRISWEIASILIAGSLAIVGFSLQSPLMTKQLFIGVSVAVTSVMAMYYSLFRRIAQLADIHIARLLEIEKELHFYQHRYVQDAHEKRYVTIDDRCYELSGLRGRYSVYLLMSFLVISVWLIALLLWL